METRNVKKILKKKISGSIFNCHILNKINDGKIGNTFFLVEKNKKRHSFLVKNGAVKVYRPGKMNLGSFIKNNKNRKKKKLDKSNVICAKKRFYKKITKETPIGVDTSTIIYHRVQNNQCQILNEHKLAKNKKSKKTTTTNKNVISFSNVYSLTKQKTITNSIWFLLIVGLFIGFINGFWGGGGGMICVPVLTLLLKMPEKPAHATTILIMLPLCIASFVVYLLKGTIIWSTAGIITAGFVVGGALGALLLKKINSTVLKIVFDIIIIAGGVKMLF